MMYEENRPAMESEMMALKAVAEPMTIRPRAHGMMVVTVMAWTGSRVRVLS
jgi:hypothetical protein